MRCSRWPLYGYQSAFVSSYPVLVYCIPEQSGHGGQDGGLCVLYNMAFPSLQLTWPSTYPDSLLVCSNNHVGTYQGMPARAWWKVDYMCPSPKRWGSNLSSLKVTHSGIGFALSSKILPPPSFRASLDGFHCYAIPYDTCFWSWNSLYREFPGLTVNTPHPETAGLLAR